MNTARSSRRTRWLRNFATYVAVVAAFIPFSCRQMLRSSDTRARSGSTLVDPRGRSKAYRPMAPAARSKALEAFLAAYAAGEFYEAHEILEPAWMGAPDQGERELLSGLIKLAAAFVHAQRGNPAGVAKNLRGARARLANAVPGDSGLDPNALIVAVNERLARLDAGAPRVEPIPLVRTGR